MIAVNDNLLMRQRQSDTMLRHYGTATPKPRDTIAPDTYAKPLKTGKQQQKLNGGNNNNNNGRDRQRKQSRAAKKNAQKQQQQQQQQQQRRATGTRGGSTTLTELCNARSEQIYRVQTEILRVSSGSSSGVGSRSASSDTSAGYGLDAGGASRERGECADPERLGEPEKRREPERRQDPEGRTSLEAARTAGVTTTTDRDDAEIEEEVTRLMEVIGGKLDLEEDEDAEYAIVRSGEENIVYARPSTLPGKTSATTTTTAEHSARRPTNKSSKGLGGAARSESKGVLLLDKIAIPTNKRETANVNTPSKAKESGEMNEAEGEANGGKNECSGVSLDFLVATKRLYRSMAVCLSII